VKAVRPPGDEARKPLRLFTGDDIVPVNKRRSGEILAEKTAIFAANRLVGNFP